MELIGLIQVFNIIVIAIGTLLYMCCISLTFSPSSSSSAADSTAVAADDDADIPPSLEKYDVFISFRGKDTRNTFTCHLHEALVQKKIETYMDERLKRGEEIGPALLEAIEKSKYWVIIFSQNYATSAWCLDELVHIIECNEKRGGQFVIPIFYHTNVSDVRDQQGSYAAAFAQHQSIDKVDKWKEALRNAANISGFPHPENTRTDANLIKKVVKDIWTKLGRESSCDLEGLVGIESRIEQIELLLGIDSPDACITVGIWGMGGIGKTTLAETVFRTLSSQFEGCCFLRNVREREQKDGLDHLEKTLLSEILKEEGPSRGSIVVQKRLSRTKVLIVLDDVSDLMQMERLAGDRRYGTGSRIIITSRDRGILRQTVEEDKIYEVERLKPKDTLQLFYLRAFKNNYAPITDYKELAKKAVANAGGVPLALILLGSSFLNCNSKEAWEQELDKLKEFPNEKLRRVLKLSYDGLERNVKEIFLDIACFHKWRKVKEVKKMLAIRGCSVEAGIRVLIDMSLISVDSKEDFGSTKRWETIEMHDLLQEMGRTIVQEQCFEDPGKRNRLYKNEDVYQVLKRNTETPRVQAVRFDWYIIQERPLKRADFKLMSDLRLLIVYSYDKFISSIELPDSLRYLYWYGYPLESLPSNFCPENLVELHLPDSKVKKLWKEDQINLSGSLKIVEINLSGCQSLVEIPSYFQHLNKLTHLDLRDCSSLKYLPEMPGNLKCLRCTGCPKLKKFPSSCVGFLSLEELKLSYSGILEIPASIKQASRLSILDLRWCQRLQSIPELPVLCNVKAEGCTSLKIVSSSRTALAQGWDKPNYYYRVFTNCPKLDNNSRSNIMDEAQIAIMRMATVAPLMDSYWPRDLWPQITVMRMATIAPLKYPPLPQNPRPQINIVCPGKEIPNWFSYQNEGSSVNIDLPSDWFRTSLFGFALSVVVSGVSQVRYDLRRVRANFIVIFMGECHKLFSSKYIIPDNSYDDDYFDGLNHVHVWNEAFRSEEVGKNCSPDVYKLAKEASVVFYPVDLEERPDSASHIKVESCGICPLYAEDAEKFKFDHVFMSREPKVEETRQDDDSKGGGSRDEPEASGSSDESEANESDDHGSEASGTEDDSDF